MKKSISFLLVAFLTLLGLTKSNFVSAQKDKITGSDQFTWSHYGNTEQCVSLFLNKAGKPVEVWVTLDFHCVCHWQYNDECDYFDQTWMLMRWRGSFAYEGVNYEINDEVTFGKNGAVNWNDPVYNSVKFVSNVKGSDGSHLLASGVCCTMYDADWNWVGIFNYDKIVCK
jgi:hypothetical protein